MYVCKYIYAFMLSICAQLNASFRSHVCTGRQTPSALQQHYGVSAPNNCKLNACAANSSKAAIIQPHSSSLPPTQYYARTVLHAAQFG